MKKRGIQVLAAALSGLLLLQSPGVAGLFYDYPTVAYANINRPATISATTLNVRSGAGTNKSIVSKLSYGAAVTVVGETKDSAGVVWYKIRFTSGSTTKEGYVSSQYVKFPVSYTQDMSFETYLNQQGFPESYKDSLRAIHAAHPTWVFQAQKTNLDWNTVIENESAVGANLVASSSLSSWKSTEYGAYDWNTGKWTGFDGASWVAASEEIVSYYMDPRNFLNDTYVFQFLTHTYDSAHQNKEGLQSLVKDTFLDAEAVNAPAKPAGPGSAVGPGSSSGPGSSASSGSTSGPGSTTTVLPATGPGLTTNQTSGSSTGPSNGPGSSTQTESTTQKVETVSPAGNQTQSGVSLVGPGASIGAAIVPRVMSILTVPTVEYGPGMDASSITGDNTGASSTSPVPEGQSYADIIMKAASQSGVNPYVIGAMILQEQGKGTSGSISGKTSGYEGYYNFFNIGAYQAGSMSAVTRGLWYASQSGNYGRPWNTIEKSIVGGSQYYGDNYVKQGQDTFYLKKYNVQGSNLYKHQYMTNVEGAAGEGAKLSRAYTDQMKNETLVFKIPVYNNMPETACAKPTGTGSPNNKLSNLKVTGYALTPTFNMNTESYDIIVNPSVERIAVAASVIDSKASVSGAGTVNLQSGNNTIYIEVTAENGHVRTYKLNVVRQADAPAVNAPVGPGSVISSGSTSGPGSTAGPGATGNSGVSSGVGPGSSTGSKPVETTPTETTAAVTTSPTPGSSQNVQVGVGPGYQNNTSQPETQSPSAPGNSGVTTPPVAETQAPVQETQVVVPETQAPAETTAAVQPTQAPAETAPQQTVSLKKGDCNGDGSITILDLMLINKQILGQNVLSGEAKKAADMNGDGSITSADATALQKKILGQ